MTQGESQVNVSNHLSLKKFAEICRATPRTIRFYHQKGLLKPAYVDKWTKYRYYKPEQARDFLKIRFMQNFNVPLKQIKNVIELKSSDSYLEERLIRLKSELDEKEKEFKSLQSLIELFFEDQDINQVFSREVLGPFNLFSLKVEHGSYDSINKYRQEIREEAKKLGLEVGESDIVLYLDKNYKPNDTYLEFALICNKDYSSQIFSLPESYSFRKFLKTKALVYEYQGLHSYFILVYQRLFDYIYKYKIVLRGNNFDINMEDGFVKKSPYDHKTRLVFPI